MTPEIMTEGVMIDGETVTNPRIVAEQDGYVAIHTMLDGQPVAPDSIGHAAVMAGVNENVEVTIDYAMEFSRHCRSSFRGCRRARAASFLPLLPSLQLSVGRLAGGRGGHGSYRLVDEVCPTPPPRAAAAPSWAA